MAEGKRREEWEQVSLLASLIHNQWRKPGQMKPPAYFNPFQRRRSVNGLRITAKNIHELKRFVPNCHRS